jgi:hypothetical protein
LCPCALSIFVSSFLLRLIGIDDPWPDTHLAAMLDFLDCRDEFVDRESSGGGVEHYELHDVALLVQALNNFPCTEIQVTVEVLCRFTRYDGFSRYGHAFAPRLS